MVSGLHHRQVDTHVGLGAGVRLDVGVLGAKERFGPFARQILADVDILAPSVVATSGVALGVLVGHHRAHRGHHRQRNEVLRGDQLETLFLPPPFVLERLSYFGISRFHQLVVN